MAAALFFLSPGGLVLCWGEDSTLARGTNMSWWGTASAVPSGPQEPIPSRLLQGTSCFFQGQLFAWQSKGGVPTSPSSIALGIPHLPGRQSGDFWVSGASPGVSPARKRCTLPDPQNQAGTVYLCSLWVGLGFLDSGWSDSLLYPPVCARTAASSPSSGLTLADGPGGIRASIP